MYSLILCYHNNLKILSCMKSESKLLFRSGDNVSCQIRGQHPKFMLYWKKQTRKTAIKWKDSRNTFLKFFIYFITLNFECYSDQDTTCVLGVWGIKVFRILWLKWNTKENNKTNISLSIVENTLENKIIFLFFKILATFLFY